jgi:hypothetical protein
MRISSGKYREMYIFRDILLSVGSISIYLKTEKLGTILDTTAILPGKGITQVVDNKVVGDTGFEPVTSTVCKRHKKRGKRKI